MLLRGASFLQVAFNCLPLKQKLAFPSVARTHSAALILLCSSFCFRPAQQYQQMDGEDSTMNSNRELKTNLSMSEECRF